MHSRILVASIVSLEKNEIDMVGVAGMGKNRLCVCKYLHSAESSR